ncbi:hypothetical protein B0H63DRAFT_507143 [Podospora didyma]|uniref:Chitin-binding type-1 domain-containing protein n=1 Tax=Podospora didyma TaxID=330526 RepID=A0AAE0NXG9_9PEZI|nr:hypothetical protein B0H63DRAFT_507143 [Podospora didyma]
MKSTNFTSSLALALILHVQRAAANKLLSSASTTAAGTGGCKPWRWDENGNDLPGSYTPPTTTDPNARPTATYSVPRKPGEDLVPGDINCRYDSETDDKVDTNTCAEIFKRYNIRGGMEGFYLLNPEVGKNCENVRPYTKYCVKGFIEPVRAWDGNCGPKYKNATCLGMDQGQCCNAETWKCGDSAEDCAPGTCYEGACHGGAGHQAYTTDGACGYDHNFRECAGKWGTCCNFAGRCGSGSDFCGRFKCQSGKCHWNEGSRFWDYDYVPEDERVCHPDDAPRKTEETIGEFIMRHHRAQVRQRKQETAKFPKPYNPNRPPTDVPYYVDLD